MLELGFPAIKEEVRRALQELIARPAFFVVDGAPADTVGFDGDSAMILPAGSLYRKENGTWVRKGEFWFDNTVAV